MDQYYETTVKSFDGSPIWYRQIGTKDPTLVLCDGVGCDGYVWKQLVPYFENSYRIIHWNYRGHGKTPVPANLDHLGIEECAQDLKAVLDNASVTSPSILIGHSMGVQVIFEFWHRFQERVRALIPMTGPYGKAIDHVYDNQIMRRMFPLAKKVVSTYASFITPVWRNLVSSELVYQYACRFEVNGKLVAREDFYPYFEHLSQMDLEVFFRTVESAGRHTAETYLPNIKLPTLIVGAMQDRFTPYWMMQRMHALIPGSEFLSLKLGTHTAPIEYPDLINLRIEKFISNLTKA